MSAVSKVSKDLERLAQAAPAVRLIRGDAVILEPVRWLWPGFLPAAMLTILGGAPRAAARRPLRYPWPPP